LPKMIQLVLELGLNLGSVSPEFKIHIPHYN
jgi:hypothetical protein